MARSGFKTVQRVPVPEPMAHIDTAGQGAPDTDEHDHIGALITLRQFAEKGGDISDLLDNGTITRLGVEAVRQFNMDSGTRSDWLEHATKYLDLAAQESGDDEREPIWENAANINYPILSTASGQFLARSEPELIKGDKVVGVKVFSPPTQKPDPIEAAKAGPQPANDQEAQQAAQALQQAQQKAQQVSALAAARNARAERIKHYMNWLIFYRMDDWEGETGLLLLQTSIIGKGFKKVYMGQDGLKSDFLSSTCLTVANSTKSIFTCPRITHDFEVYPYEIENRRRDGTYRDIELPRVSEDPEMPRKFIEQHRLDDLDGDGLAEPYIVTVDIETQQLMRVEPAYTQDDIIVNEQTGKVMRINRWLPFPEFTFLPDPRGHFYAIGLGSLLDSITDTVDTFINQMVDAGTAQIAGGGLIAGGLRLQGSGQGGSVFLRPGEYQTASINADDIRKAVWERTVPQASPVAFQMLEMLLAAAKDIASVKDVITGESPATAPVGTTLALQNQALQVFSSIYKRIYRGFKQEFQLMYQCLKRYPTDRERQEYQELTGGDFDQDFSGDGTDIQPVADPTVVSKMQKIAKYQTVMQLAESPVGMAAGMTQSGPAQEFVKDFLDVIDMDRPERFVAPVPPNPELVAKANLMQAQAQKMGADTEKAAADATKTQAETAEIGADIRQTHAETLNTHADTLETTGRSALQHHEMHRVADQIEREGSLQPPPEEEPEAK